MKLLFRVFETATFGDENAAMIYIEAHPVIRSSHSCDYIKVDGKEKRICHTINGGPTRKRWAYPTEELALNSFLRRKDHQIIHLNNTLKVVENALEQARQPGFKPTKWASYELLS